jgi:hypothetical protein
LLRRENPRIGVHDANLKMMYAIPERTGVVYINFLDFFAVTFQSPCRPATPVTREFKILAMLFPYATEGANEA